MAEEVTRGAQAAIPTALVAIVALVSGAAGLAAQVVWTQQAGIWLGHDVAAVLAVVSAFFGGMALGAALLGRRIEASARPLAWYVGCEVTMAAWTVLLAACFDSIGPWWLQGLGPQPSPWWHAAVAFGGTFVILLPATATMGATLPALQRSLAAGAGRRSIARLYAANTAGAAAGVLGTTFWALPFAGLRHTAYAYAAANLACAAVAAVAASRQRAAGLASTAPPAAAGPSGRRGPLQAALALMGLLGIGYEVIAVRVLSQVAEKTVYTYAILLAVYLAGTAIGAAAYGHGRMRRGSQPGMGLRDADVQARLASLLVMAGLVGAIGLWSAAAVHERALVWFGTGLAASLAAETLVALAAFGVPTLAMGAMFCHLADRAEAQGLGWGRALAFNALGAAAAPVLVGVLLVPLAGLKAALLVLVAGYLLLVPWGAAHVRRPWAPVGGLVVLAIAAPPLAFIAAPDGGRIVSHRDGTMAAVSVVADDQGVLRLYIDNRQQEGSSGTRVADARQGLLPLLLHGHARRVLFLGLGTGVTASAAAAIQGGEVEAVELLPEVVDASALFRRSAALEVRVADARRHVRTAQRDYDVIVSDNFHPARSGSAALYTVEHFAAVRQRLTPGGLFCQWLPLHQLDEPTLRSIVRSFLAVFPRGYAVLATNSLETPVIGLVAGADARGPGPADVQRRLAVEPAPGPTWKDLGFPDAVSVLGSVIAGPSSLQAWAAAAPLNTDDRPVVSYLAPRSAYEPQPAPRDRLAALLSAWRPQPLEWLAAADAPAWAERVSAYAAARQQYLAAGRDVQLSPDVQTMLAQVRDPLLAVLRTSPDFSPAYDPLLRMAEALARSDPAAAQTLLVALNETQPARDDAARVLARLASNR